MRSIEMILMTKSSKYGGYCVAGFDCADGRWIRLVSEDKETHGALNDEMLYDRKAKRCAGLLDRVLVEVREDVPGPVQRENVLIAGEGKIRILGKIRLEEAIKLHPCEERADLFGSHHHIVQTDVTKLQHSLEMVRVQDFHLYTTIGASGKPKYKADFTCRGVEYTGFAMTDPEYYPKNEMRLDEAVLVLSISDDEWSHANGHYIYIARIFPVRSGRLMRTWRRKRIWIGAGAAAALIGLIVWMAALGSVYIAPYSGTKYHASDKCERLINPVAAQRIPLAAGRLLFSPCELCADRNE
ncbi:MAG: hypothetical protein IJE08_12955 [Clostridia bacterium]|nr:hypothetical protein [Clostridia bacterium]